MRDLAQRLLALEAGQSDSPQQVHEGVRVCEKLRISLTRFAGADGFSALMRRSLALACVDEPTLETVRVNPDGSVDGLQAFPAGEGDGRAAEALITHLLELLNTFIGETLTLRLVSDAWPEAPLHP